MDRSAIDYLNYLESSDSFFYKNFKEFIIYASGLNKNLKDPEYNELKKAKDSEYRITLKDKRTSINMIKNFFYKISPNIIKQIDFDVLNNNIQFVSKEEIEDGKSQIIMDGANYKIQIADTSRIEEAYYLVREYAHLFAGNILDAVGIDKGLKRVYVEVITSLTEFALAKHLSFNTAVKNDSKNYIYKKLYNSIYKMNDSYMTLIYLGYLLEGKEHDEMIKYLGGEEILSKLDNIIKEKKPCKDYINTLGTMIALKEANNTDNIYDLVNNYYIKSTSIDIDYFKNNIAVNLDQMDSVEEITYYIRNY